ncbi:MAG: nucleotide sugar dehydrogenase [Candidatus Omnitrophota bacterium]|jgi:nucleotide sugar dehydrogenase
MDSYALLKNKIKTKSAKIGIIGLGYVGLPLAVAFAKKGYFVYGFDTNQKNIDRLKKGEKYIVDIDPKEVLRLIAKKNFSPTAKPEVLKECDAIIICVPTPLRKVKVPDISYVVAAVKTIRKYLGHQLIVLESTSYPTTTREVVLPILKETGLKEEQDFFLCFSPERVNPADKKFPLTKIPKLVGGLSAASTELAKNLYSKIIEKVFGVSSPEAAETAKLLENTFRMVNIALANEFAIVCNKLGIDVWEVINAAKTKPFGFMPFYPGPGLGGHCLDGKEVIFSDNGKGIEVKTIDSLTEIISKDPMSLKKKINGVEYLKPAPNYKMLTFDVEKKEAIFKPIEMFSKRKTESDLFKITTNDNRNLRVTHAHPMFVLEGCDLKVKLARDLEIGDEIPFVLKTDFETKTQDNTVLKFDVINYIRNNPQLVDKIRVRPRIGSWSAFKEKIYKIKFDNQNYHDYIRGNYLPLKYFISAEESKLLSISHKDLLLCSGRGPSYMSVPAVIEATHEFCRLMGYYLSEGCITTDKSMRVRFCFNSNEKEYIEDVCAILKSIGIKYSLYHSKQWKASYIKVSSNIFGFLLKEILKCGSNCYEMNIPAPFLKLDKQYKWELLKGLFRGDGGVDIETGKASYIKNGKQYCHNRNSIGINYFSSSKVLFQQVIFLLHDFGIVPTFRKREGLLYIFGYKQAERFKDFFLGSKSKKVEAYFINNRKIISSRGFKSHEGFGTSIVKSIERTQGDYVYSAEVKDTHTIVTSYGTIVHNCIPVDPLYLSWKAKKLGFKTKMIDLASYINRFMPNYVVERVEKILKEKGVALNKAKILIIGVTYKKDVKDLRESPALEIIKHFQERGVDLSFYDLFIPYLKIKDINLKGVPLTGANLKKSDCVLIVTDHASIDYDFIRENCRLIFDTRNIYKKDFKNVIRL